MTKRIKFFVGHLSVSAFIALIMVSVVFFCWYPAPLAKAIGVTKIFLMLIAIDVIVGPLFTLLVYKEGKKTLKMDLMVIVLIQILAFLYGIHNIIEGRPAWIVQKDDRFELIRNNDVIRENIDQVKPEYQKSSWFKPQFVYIDYGTTDIERHQKMMDDLSHGIVASYNPKRYSDMKYAKVNIQKKMQKNDKLLVFNHKISVKRVLKKYPQAVGWMPLSTNNIDMVVLLDKEGQVVKIVDLRPWK